MGQSIKLKHKIKNNFPINISMSGWQQYLDYMTGCLGSSKAIMGLAHAGGSMCVGQIDPFKGEQLNGLVKKGDLDKAMDTSAKYKFEMDGQIIGGMPLDRGNGYITIVLGNLPDSHPLKEHFIYVVKGTGDYWKDYNLFVIGHKSEGVANTRALSEGAKYFAPDLELDS
eukprot:TRINITY_DN22098_c0_g1_i1.p1 TRINITY_DN22098_c0_g1~~TRINITY_DN22098_c0_g1_i1.p1  ORF type:complete len:169 (-),score=14.54 TRINITY_DN22098_c0_g1_i1:78-584(-)